MVNRGRAATSLGLSTKATASPKRRLFHFVFLFLYYCIIVSGWVKSNFNQAELVPSVVSTLFFAVAINLYHA